MAEQHNLRAEFDLPKTVTAASPRVLALPSDAVGTFLRESVWSEVLPGVTKPYVYLDLHVPTYIVTIYRFPRPVQTQGSL